MRTAGTVKRSGLFKRQLVLGGAAMAMMSLRSLVTARPIPIWADSRAHVLDGSACSVLAQVAVTKGNTDCCEGQSSLLTHLRVDWLR